LMNFKKHLKTAGEIDPCSSAAWFTGWRIPHVVAGIRARPVAIARTWLARIGWRRHGLLGWEEGPADHSSSSRSRGVRELSREP
jgi:hypothetical protein